MEDNGAFWSHVTGLYNVPVQISKRGCVGPITAGWTQWSSGWLPAATFSLHTVHKPHHCPQGPANNPLHSISVTNAQASHYHNLTNHNAASLLRADLLRKEGARPGPSNLSNSLVDCQHVNRKGSKGRRQYLSVSLMECPPLGKKY